MYYLKKNGKIFGPFALAKLQGMVEKGKISPENSISENRSDWIDAAGIKELFPNLVSTVSSPVTALQPEELAIDLKEELKIKTLNNDNSYVNKMSDPNLPHVRESSSEKDKVPKQDEKFRFISVFWNPVYALPVILENSQSSKIKVLSMLFAFLDILFFLFAMLCSGIIARTNMKIVLMLVVSVIPFFSFVVSFLLLKKIFTEKNLKKNQLLLKEICLISGITLFPACSLILFVSLIKLSSILSSSQIIVLLSGLSIYGFAYSVLLLFNACTRLLGIRGSATVFVVSTLLLISTGLTGFFIRLLLL